MAEPVAAGLPQLQGQLFVTDGGLETDLVFHHGIDLPEFAAYPLLADESGRSLLTNYYDDYAVIAARAAAGLILEAPTWRSNPNWGAKLGDDAGALHRINTGAIEFMAGLRAKYADTVPIVQVSGAIGPRGDGYRTDGEVDPDEAREYHGAQVRAFAEAGADLALAMTLTEPGEAIGIVQAARAAGLPIAIAFTVETDGHLPGGKSLAEAITEVDASAPPDYFLVNCAHPSHVEAGLVQGAWRDRVLGMRPNASLASHAELDEAEVLDEGDPAELASAQRRVAAAFENATILGGCCGTDARHVAAMWGVAAP